MNANFLENLNKEQRAAAERSEGPLLIVAGAGTGKTTVIAKKIAYLIESGKAKPEEILAVTFTEKAAQEMEGRVDALLPFSYLNIDICTFHAFCEKILKEHGLEIGLSTDFKLLNQTDAWLLVRENLEKFNLDYYRPLGNPTKFIHALIKHFSRAKDEEVWPEDYLKCAAEAKLNKDVPLEGEALAQEIARLEETANAYHVYQKTLLENNCLDFGDLINYALRLFRTRPKILDYHRRKYKYVLVDEFQDTNWAQYELIKLLSAPKNNLTVVADDDQSIYKFRGASVSNVLEFKKDFPKAEEIVLTRNYRSPQNLLDLTYNFIQLNNPNRLEYQLNQKEKKSAIKSPINKRLISDSPKPAMIEIIAAKTEQEEAAAVAEKIINLKNSGRGKEKSGWSDFAVLVRANGQADVFLQEILNRGVPCQFLASAGLYRKPIVMDILAYLRLLDNYHESSSLFRVLNLPFFNFTGDEIADLTQASRQKPWSLYEVLKRKNINAEADGEIKDKISNLLSLLEKHAAAAKEKGVSRAIYAFLEDSGYLRFLASGGKNAKKSAEAISHLNQFYKKVEMFERESPDKSLKAFMKKMDLIAEAGDEGGLENDAEAGPETVKIMTVHGAKGLEFDYVFIVNLVDRRFPTTERREQIELPAALVKETIPEGDIHLEEERRLFYVACTRAKKGLFLTSAEDYGGTRKKKPSRFLYEIGLLKEKKIAAAKAPAGRRREKPEKSVLKARVQEMPKISETAENPPFAVPKEFSFSQIKAFETCPWQYRFAHVLRIPVKGRASFSFGKSIHGALQKFFRQILERSGKNQGELFGLGTKRGGARKASGKNAVLSLDEFLKFYEQSWIEDWYADKKEHDEYKKKGEKMLKEFYAAGPNDWLAAKFIEQDFKLKIIEPETGAVYPVKGVIDRIDELPGGSLEIIDYKTGKPAKNEKDIDKNQLLLYQIAAEEILKKPVEKLSYYFLENNSKISFKGTEKDAGRLKNELIARIQRIKNCDFPPSPSPFTCGYCDFKEICEFRELR